MSTFFGFLLGLSFLLFPDFTSRLVYCWAIQSVSRPHETDEKLILRFHQQRHAFETLRTMIASDTQLERMDDTWTRPSDLAAIGISEDRKRTYKTLLDKVSIPRGIEAYDKERRSFRLLASTQGTTVSGSTKGYLWSADPPAPQVDELDSAVAGNVRPFFGYRHIADDWYLFFERE